MKRRTAKKPQSAEPAQEPWRNPVLGPCACSQLRRAGRAVSAFYDGYLAAAGLTVTQYAILVNIGRSDAISRSDLAVRLGMDRTTVTRNLQPLERDGFVTEQPGEDRRERQVTLTRAGRRKLDTGYVHWAAAQQAFVNRFGGGQVDQLRFLLDNATKSATLSADELPLPDQRN